MFTQWLYLVSSIRTSEVHTEHLLQATHHEEGDPTASGGRRTSGKDAGDSDGSIELHNCGRLETGGVC